MLGKIWEGNLVYRLTLLLLLLLPFEYLPTLDLFGYTVKLSYLVALALVAVYILQGSWRNLKLTATDYFLLAFVASSFLTIIWSINPLRSLITSCLFLFVVIVYFVLKQSIEPAKLERYYNIIIGVGVAAALFALWQFVAEASGALAHLSFLRSPYQSEVFGFPRVHSTFLEPLYFANFLLVPVYLTMRQMMRRRGRPYGYALLILLTVFFLTLSRGALWSLLVSFILLSLYLLGRFRSHLKRILLIVAIASFAFGAAMGLVYLAAGEKGVRSYVEQSGTAEPIPDTETAASGARDYDYITSRGYTMRVAIDKIVEQPWGVGAGAFGALPEFEPIRAKSAWQIVNNLYLEILVEEGMLGFILFGLFLILFIGENLFALIDDYSERQIDNLFLTLALVAIFIQYMTFSTLYVLSIWVFLALAEAAKNAAETNQR